MQILSLAAFRCHFNDSHGCMGEAPGPSLPLEASLFSLILAAFVRLPLFWPSWFPSSSEHVKALLPEGVGTCRLLSLEHSPSPFLAHSYSSYRTQCKYPFLSRPRDSQESSPTSQFKSINSLALSFLFSPTLTCIRDYWKKP